MILIIHSNPSFIFFSFEQFFNASAPISNLGKTYLGMICVKCFVSLIIKKVFN